MSKLHTYDRPPPLYGQRSFINPGTSGGPTNPPPAIPPHSNRPPAYSNHNFVQPKDSLNNSWSTQSSLADNNRTMGPRRDSWLNLVESQQNLNLNTIYNVSNNPKGQDKKMAMMTVTDKGRFMKSADYHNNKRGLGELDSNASTASEFILVPNSYPPSQAVSSSKSGCCIPFSSRNTVILLIVIFSILAAAAVIAVVTKTTTKWPKVYQFESGIKGSKDHHVINIVLSQNGRATFTVVGGRPYANVKTTIDLDKEQGYTYDSQLLAYCILEQLNITNTLPLMNEIEEAAQNSVKNPPPTNDWLQDWHWDLEEVKDQNDLHWDLCPGNRRLQLIPSRESNFAKPCPGCSQVCYPNYDIIDIGGNDPRLAIINFRCLWLFVPEWTDYVIPGFGPASTDLETNREKFIQYYKQGLHRTAPKLRPSKSKQPWVIMNTPTPVGGQSFNNNKKNMSCFNPVLKVYEVCPDLSNVMKVQASRPEVGPVNIPTGQGWINVDNSGNNNLES